MKPNLQRTRRIALLLVSIFCLFALAGCASSPQDGQSSGEESAASVPESSEPESSEPESFEPEPSEPESSEPESSEPESSEPESSEPEPSEPEPSEPESSEPESSEPESSDTLRLNTDLLSDIGRSYGELAAKYGEGYALDAFEEELSARFQNSAGYYQFRGKELPGSAYSSAGEDEVIPEADAVCFAIDLDASALFDGLTGRHTLQDVEALGVSVSIAFSRESSFAGEIDGVFGYFEYGKNKVYLTLDSADSAAFTPDSKVFFVLK